MVLYEYAVGKKIEAVNTKETIERDIGQMSINREWQLAVTLMIQVRPDIYYGSK